MKFFDVNLRPPFVDPQLVIDLAKRADVLKLNDGEVANLIRGYGPASFSSNTPRAPNEIAQACATIADATKASRICVTLTEEGAALRDHGNLITAPAPKVAVKDTVGAGDAFMAGLLVGRDARESRLGRSWKMHAD